jgi:hypothetical protein
MTYAIIKATPSSEAANQRLLDGIQNRATARILTFKLLLDLANEAEVLLAQQGLTKPLKVGARYHVGPEIPVNAYKYPSESTTVDLIRRPGGWAIEHIERVTNWPIRGGCARDGALKLTDAALEHLLAKSIYHSLVARKVANAFRAGAESVRQGTITKAVIPPVQPAAVPEVMVSPAASPALDLVPVPTLLPAPEAFNSDGIPLIQPTPEAENSAGGRLA